MTEGKAVEKVGLLDPIRAALSPVDAEDPCLKRQPRRGRGVAHHTSYPTDQAGRRQLADELAATGVKPTQWKQHFDRDKINRMVEAMRDDTFDWNKASLQPVILGPNGEVMGGHHRVIAAHLAVIDLTAVPGPRPQVQSLPKNFRPVLDWIDVLPDVP